MAKIPALTTQPSPTPRAGGGLTRYRQPDTAGAVAGASAALGEGAQAGLEQIYRAQKIEEERMNTLLAEGAYNDLRARQGELTHGEQDGFTRRKGEQVVGHPILKDYTEKFDDAERSILERLKNDRQRELFRNRAKISRAQFQEEILRHMAREGDTYADQVYKGTVATELQAGATRWDSPNDVAISATRIAAAVATRADAAGWAKDYRDAVTREHLGKLHSEVVNQAIANGRYVYAKAWFDKHKDSVSPDTAKVLARAVEGAEQRELGDRLNAEFLAQRESIPGLQALEKKVLGSSLDEGRKNVIHGRILGRIDRLEAAIEREKTKRLRTIEKAIDAANANTLAGMPQSYEQIAPILEAARETELAPEAERMVALANATTRFAALPPLTQQREITTLERQVRAEPGKFDRRVLDAYKTIAAEQQKMIDEDPNTFAMRQGIATATPIDLSQPLQAGDALAERYASTRALQATHGAPNKPLTAPEARLVSEAIAGAGWKERRDYLTQLYQASRGDLHGYSGIMAQIAQDHPLTAIAGEYGAKGRTQAAELILAGEAILRPSKKADGKPDGSGLLPLPPEPDMRSEFDSDVREAYAGRPELRNAMYQAARAIYAKLASDKGVKDTKALDSSLWDQAMLLATGGMQRHNGRTIPMPYGMDLSEFRAQVKRRTEDLEAAGTLPEGVGAFQLQTLPLEPVGDGRYAFSTGTGILMHQTKDRGLVPLLLDFNRSQAYRPSGYGLEPPTDRERWMKETGGRLGKGQNEEQAIKLWRSGATSKPPQTKARKPAPAGKPSTPAGGSEGGARG